MIGVLIPLVFRLAVCGDNCTQRSSAQAQWSSKRSSSANFALLASALERCTVCSRQGHLPHSIFIDNIILQGSGEQLYFLRFLKPVHLEVHNYFIKISADLAREKFRNKKQFPLTLRWSLLIKVS